VGDHRAPGTLDSPPHPTRCTGPPQQSPPTSCRDPPLRLAAVAGQRRRATVPGGDCLRCDLRSLARTASGRCRLTNQCPLPIFGTFLQLHVTRHQLRGLRGRSNLVRSCIPHPLPPDLSEPGVWQHGILRCLSGLGRSVPRLLR